MKTIILSINSKYIHTLLAPRYLKANCKLSDLEILESNINVNHYGLLSELYLKKPDVIAICCYIFNIDYIMRLLPEIRLLLPDARIILGGYEAAFDSGKYLPLCDYIIKGEGDFVFNELLLDIYNNTGKFPRIIEAGTVKNLDDIASPYSDEYCALGKTKILYYESSRGCPFCCSYCMSANTHGVRSFSMERVFADLNKIMKHNPLQIKFVDRTFNYDVKRAAAILKYIIDNFSDSDTNFHFEMSPELFGEDMFSVLSRAKKGLIQFEIGIQSYNEKTLKSVGRSADIQKIEYNLKRLRDINNIHIHADLIAGLPYENLESFIAGFDRLFNLKPHCLQLGFLKILKGSKIFYDSEGFVAFNAPPYEVIKTPNLSFDDILKLKTAEEMLEMYYNSGRFVYAMDYLLPRYFQPYWFFYNIGLYRKKYYDRQNLSAFGQCSLLYDFVACSLGDKEFLSVLTDIINKDYSASGNIRKWRRNKSVYQ
jgi:radical SAM superfamily enzyme YgiQ (UPF0313 family)